MSKFSVLIPVYKNDKPLWFKEALRSIYEIQTVKPSEIVVVFDGPVCSKIVEIINFYKYKKKYPLKVIQLKENRGLAVALNEGLKHCTYELVARMDADDVSLPNRFELLLKAFKRDPEVVVVGGFIEEFDPEMKSSCGYRTVPLDYEKIVKYAKKRSPFNHMTVMYKKSIILKEGGYPLFRWGQDYALWVKLITKGYKLKNIPEVLVKARGCKTIISRRKGIKYLKNEINLILFFKKVGFYNLKDIIIWGVPRIIIRLFPDFILKWIYSNFLRVKNKNLIT